MASALLECKDVPTSALSGSHGDVLSLLSYITARKEKLVSYTSVIYMLIAWELKTCNCSKPKRLTAHQSRREGVLSERAGGNRAD